MILDAGNDATERRGRQAARGPVGGDHAPPVSRRRRDRTRSRTRGTRACRCEPLAARGRGVRPRRPAPPVTRRRSAARRHAARAAAARGPRRRGSVARPSPRPRAPMQDPHPGARQTQREEPVPEQREGRHRRGCRRGDVDGQRVGGRAVVRAVVHREGDARRAGAGRARGRGVRAGRLTGLHARRAAVAAAARRGRAAARRRGRRDGRGPDRVGCVDRSLRNMSLNRRRWRGPAATSHQESRACVTRCPPVFTSRCGRRISDQRVFRCGRPTRHHVNGSRCASATRSHSGRLASDTGCFLARRHTD